MNKYLFVSLILISQILCAHAQVSSDPVNNAAVNLYSQLLVYPQEKAYVQTDRPYYLSGEKIFFRAFILQASTLTQASYSRYVYVELVSPLDTVVIRKQIRLDENKLYYGVLPLPESLPEGEYRIRCYTRFMENLGEPFFFTRPVYIAVPNSAKVEIQPWFDFSKQGEVALSLKLDPCQATQPRLPDEIVCRLGNGQQKVVTRAEFQDGTYKKFELKDANASRALLIEYKSGRNSFSKYIRVPYKGNKPEISFYPEGGNMISGQKNRIAFKALLPDGNAAEIKGSVYNSHNDRLATFETRHEGMGDFTLKTQAGESYFARWDYNGQAVEQKLPDVKSNTFSLKASWEGDSLSISVLKPEGLPEGLYYLFMHRQGLPVYFKPWDFSKNEIKRSKEKFVTGVTHIMLLDKDFVPVSERMVFNNLDDEAKVEIISPTWNFKPRQHVALDIRVNDYPVDTVPASMAISVTDDQDAHIDTTTDIQSEILLVSELQGHIHNPAWYFGRQKEAREAADLLMLTHGWRNYHVADALQGKIQHPAIKPEVTQSLSGQLTKTTGRPYKGIGKIKMSAVGYDFSEVVESDDKGRYEFTDFEFPDSTAYFFLANAKEKTTDIEIHPDQIYYPTSTIPWPAGPGFTESWEKHALLNSVNKADKKYLQENGMRMIDLPELNVTAYKKEPKPKRLDNFLAPGMQPDRFISSEQMKEFPPSTYEELFWRIPGVTNVSPETGVTIRGDSGLILVNGIEADYSHIDTYANIREIAQVDVYTDLSVIAMYAGASKTGQSRNPSAIIALTTWPPGSSDYMDETNNTVHLLPLGYQEAIEFYSPRYDSTEPAGNKQDLRSTIYWKPNVMTDNSGKATVDFYAADTPGTYSVVIEGIAPGRKLICYKKAKLLRVTER